MARPPSVAVTLAMPLLSDALQLRLWSPRSQPAEVRLPPQPAAGEVGSLIVTIVPRTQTAART